MTGRNEPQEETRDVAGRASRALLGALLSALGTHGGRKQKLVDELTTWTKVGLERFVGRKGAVILRVALGICVLGGAAASLLTAASALVLAAVRLAQGRRLTP